MAAMAVMVVIAVSADPVAVVFDDDFGAGVSFRAFWWLH